MLYSGYNLDTIKGNYVGEKRGHGRALEILAKTLAKVDISQCTVLTSSP
jgi:hypothetical protein